MDPFIHLDLPEKSSLYIQNMFHSRSETLKIIISDIPSDQPTLYSSGFQAGVKVGKHEKALTDGKLSDPEIHTLTFIQAFNHGRRVGLKLEEPPSWSSDY